MQDFRQTDGLSFQKNMTLCNGMRYIQTNQHHLHILPERIG